MSYFAYSRNEEIYQENRRHLEQHHSFFRSFFHPVFFVLRKFGKETDTSLTNFQLKDYIMHDKYRQILCNKNINLDLHFFVSNKYSTVHFCQSKNSN